MPLSSRVCGSFAQSPGWSARCRDHDPVGDSEYGLRRSVSHRHVRVEKPSRILPIRSDPTDFGRQMYYRRRFSVLIQALDIRFFPELWEVRTEL